jgi:dynein heavy chain
MICHRCYVTPRSFLDLLAQYGHLLNASRAELGDKRRRYLDGIAKLNETKGTLTAMRSQLNDLKPLLAEKTAATSTLLQQVSTRCSGFFAAGSCLKGPEM